jgi:hypothetical protein
MIYIENIVIYITNFFFLQNHWFIIKNVNCIMQSHIMYVNYHFIKYENVQNIKKN